MPRWSVLIARLATDKLDAIDRFDVRRIQKAIDQQLETEPNVETKSRKPLEGTIEPPFPHEKPVWELRVGPWRVFYSFGEDELTVFVWAIVRKGKQTTEEAMKKS